MENSADIIVLLVGSNKLHKGGIFCNLIAIQRGILFLLIELLNNLIRLVHMPTHGKS